MPRKHSYSLTVTWTGNTGTGTSGYRDYKRSYDISGEGKPVITGSSDPVFRGDRTRWNPEELLVAALASCHKLSYLHLCADAEIVVIAYEDHADGVMQETTDGGGKFIGVTLRPHVTVKAGSDQAKAQSLHEAAHAKCFIASSVNFPVHCEAVVELKTAT
jgi:organic hydroperoxide reductase OsmC/OhrA